MPVPFRFTIPEDDPYDALKLDDCQYRLRDESLSTPSRLSLLRHQSRLLIESGALMRASDLLTEAIAIQPNDPFSHAYRGWALEQWGQNKQAQAMYQKALNLLKRPGMGHLEHPIVAQLWYRSGVMLRTQSLHKQALEHYGRAIDLQPNFAEAVSGRSVVLALMGQHKRAQQESDRALRLRPNSPLVLNNSGIVLMAARHYRLALDHFQQVIEQDSDFDRAWYNQGLALMRLGQSEQALTCLERALDIDSPLYLPTALSAGSPTALPVEPPTDSSVDSPTDSSVEPPTDSSVEPPIKSSVEPPIGSLHSPPKSSPNSPLKSSSNSSPQGFQTHFQERISHCRQRPWVLSAWTLHAFLSLKKRDLTTTINSSRQVQRLDSNNYSAALYKFTAMVGKGQLWSQLKTQRGRKEVGHDVLMIANGLKYRLLGLVSIMVLLLWGEGQVMDLLRQYVPLVLSFGIIALVGMDLWQHKSRLRFVWKTYFGAGLLGNILTYIRALLILVITLTTFTMTYHYAPAFLKWGWANAVFGSSGNIIFQPLNLIQDLSIDLNSPGLHQVSEFQTGLNALLANIPLTALGNLWSNLLPIPVGFLGTPLFHIGPIHISAASVLTILFWLALIIGVPFWAHLEEKIFRQGANNWKMITIRSIQFGLVHLLAGIPILGGFVLIVPGFLFACRYKYVRDRHYCKYHDPAKADQAGVLASTADHAVYNAILMTLAVSAILLGTPTK